MNTKEAQLKKLKQIFPEAFTEDLKIDWEKLKLTLGENIDIGKERYGIIWPGKADCFKTKGFSYISLSFFNSCFLKSLFF